MQDKKQSPNFAATKNGASDKESSSYSNKSRSYTQGSQSHVDDIARALSALNHLESGRPYDEWMKIGMAAKSAGISFDDFNTWSASGYNYESENVCRKFWDGIKE